MKKEAFIAKNAPAAIGPYSHANIVNDMVFVSGQLPLKDGEIVTDIKEATRASILNLKTILEEAGSDLEHVVKTLVFLTDMNDFAAMNEVYGEFFTSNFPARSAIAVKTLPKGATVEIEAVAVRK